MTADRFGSGQGIRTVLLFVAVTAIHFFTSIVLWFYIFGMGMARFDSGAPESAAESVMRWAFAILSFPLLKLLERMPVARFPGLWGYVPFLGNALLWGAAVPGIRWWLRARGSRRSPP